MTEPNAVQKLAHNKIFWIGGIVAGGVILYEYRKQKTAAANAVVPTAADATVTALDPNASNDYSAATGGAIGSPYGGVNTVNLNTSPTSNADWVQKATTALIGLSYDPATVAAALGKYILGAGLSSNELQIVQAALGQLGNPPQAVPAPTLAQPSGQKPDGSQEAARAHSPQIQALYDAYLSANASGNGQLAAAAQKTYLDAVNAYDAGILSTQPATVSS